MKNRWLWIGVAAVVVLAGVAAVVASTGGDDEGPLEVGEVTVTGTPLPSFTDPANDAATGQVAPTVVGRSFDADDQVTIQPGRPTLVLFLAHWCPHCQAEVPVIVEHLREELLPGGVDLLAVSTAVSPDRPNYPASAWLAKEGWDFPVLLDDAETTVAQAYGLSGFPYLVALDADGKVAARGSGEFTTDQFDAFVEAATR